MLFPDKQAGITLRKKAVLLYRQTIFLGKPDCSQEREEKHQ
jgi:hypothetical protein